MSYDSSEKNTPIIPVIPAATPLANETSHTLLVANPKVDKSRSTDTESITAITTANSTEMPVRSMCLWTS